MSDKNHFSGEHLAPHFEDVKALLPGADISWLSNMRENAIEKFLETGIPGPRVEEWKYTNLSAYQNSIFETVENTGDADDETVEMLFLNDIEGSKVVFIDGYLSEKHTSIKEVQGVHISSIADYVKSSPDRAQSLMGDKEYSSSLANLNLAMMTGGYVLDVDQDAKLAEPIQIIHIAAEQGETKSLRTLNYISIASGGSAQIIESFVSQGGDHYWRQSNNQIALSENATLEIFQYQTEAANSIHMGETHVAVKGGANFRHYSLNIGGKISRTEIKPTLIGENGNVELRGAFLGRGGNSHDVFTHMKHMVPECESDQVYRGVLDKGGKSAFQGRVYVAKDAQLTNAEQSNKNLILDRSAEANSKPELLIYADDVQCAHGATVGEMDQEALFYLKSRGLNQKSAKALLVEAFVAEVFDKISIESVREKYLALARGWLEQGE